MADVIYKGYRIKVRSAIQHADGGWEALAMVWRNEEQKNVGHPIPSGELQDTEARANAVALERAKAWVDAKEEGKRT